MKRVTQKDVTWVKKDPKTKKGGYLALRSDTSKPFSGVVTGIKAGTTRSIGGEAVYKAGRNVQRMKDAAAARKGTGAAKESAASYVAKPKKAAPPPAKTPTRMYEERKARPAPKRKEYGGLEKAGRSVAGALAAAGSAVAGRLSAPNKGAIKYETKNGKRIKYKYNGTRWIKQL